MKAKLFKVENTTYYNLQNEKGILIGTTFEFKNDVGDGLYSLSYKNCQAIENGYDLDELAKDYANGKSSSDVFKDAHKRDFKEGFQKALEILGDKEFSEEDMRKAFIVGFLLNKGRNPIIEFEVYLESLQQTEWGVEIEMDILNEYDKPKLDADGCIILKRK